MDMKPTAADFIHAIAYLLPGLSLWTLVGLLCRYGRRVAAYEKAPRWARRYYRFSAGLLFLVGGGALAIGAGLAVAVLR
jgi:hypothetical protein